MRRWTLLLATHLVLLVLASTSLTVITGWNDGRFAWQYFRIVSQSGWGLPYQFPYSLPVVLTYLAAYGVGLATYAAAWRKGCSIVGSIGVLLCALGLASFAYELTHWFSAHYGSWIVSFPIALLLLAIPTAVQVYRRESARLEFSLRSE